MNDATTPAEAKQWCDQARELINSRRDKSSDLKAARSQIKKASSDLEGDLKVLQLLNPVRTYELKKRYVTLAEVIWIAAVEKNDVGLIEAAKSIEALHADTLLEIVEQKDLDAKLVTFDQEHLKLNSKVAEARGLRGAYAEGSLVKEALELAAARLIQAQALRIQASALKAGVDMETASGLHESVRQQLIAAAEASVILDKGAKNYLKAMTDWGELKPKVLKAQKELDYLSGAVEQAKLLRGKYNEAIALIKQVDGVWLGHAEAKLKVALYEKDLNDGRAANTDHVTKGVPDKVKAAFSLTDAQLVRYATLAPSHALDAHREHATCLAESGRSDVSAALEGLRKLTTLVKAESDELEAEQKKAVIEETSFRTGLEAMGALNVPVSLFAAQKYLGNLAIQGDLIEHQWEMARIKLEAANAVIASIKGDFEINGAGWDQRRLALAEMRTQAVGLISFPAVSANAMALRDAVSQVQEVFTTVKLAESVSAYDAARLGGKTLPAARDALLVLARQKKVPFDNPEQMKAFSAQLARATSDVYAAGQTARTQILKRLDELVDLTPEARQGLQTDWVAQITELESKWLLFRATAGGEVKALNKQSKDIVKEIVDLATNLVMRKPKLLLQEEASKAQVAQSVANAKALPDQVKARLAQLALRGLDVKAEQKQFEDSSKTAAELMIALTERETDWLSREATRRKDLMDKINATIDQPLSALNVSETYRKELAQQSVDIQIMVSTQDPDLVTVAESMQMRMQLQLAQIKTHRDLYDRNITKLEKLMPRIGDLASKLPVTHRRLQTALTEELVASKHNSPLDMATRVLALARRVDEAWIAAAARDELVLKYKRKKIEVRSKWSKVKDVGDAPQFQTYYEARIAEAKQLKTVEGGLPGAQQMLKALEKKLDSVLGEKVNPTAKLKALNSDQMQSQRLVVDMAEQFQREVSLILGTVLPEAKAATKAAEDGDSEMAKSLEGVVDAASKIVSPYLQNLTLFKRGAAPAPDIARMKSDFERASSILADANRTALRLIETPETTNVEGPMMGAKVREGLSKLSKKWGERTNAFNTAVRSVASSVRTAAASDDETVKASAEKAALIIEKLSSMFRSNAFGTSFAVLMQERPKDAGERAVLRTRQLAAREAALLVMRQCHSDLQNPLLRKLTDSLENPFEAPTIKVAASGISTVLKEIQLQALASA